MAASGTQLNNNQQIETKNSSTEVFFQALSETTSVLLTEIPTSTPLPEITISEPPLDPINVILKKRNLNEKIFSTTQSIQLADPFEHHVAWAFRNIFSIPYPYYPKKSGIARFIHGIQHVTRAACYVPILANLYRRYKDPRALELKEKDIKLIQIAVLFHDAARLDEEVDKWDRESGELLYYYLTCVLKVDETTSRKLSHAVAHKDAKSPKNIYQSIIQCVDCLDIMRARPHFDATYLDFYKEIAKDNKNAFEEMAQLIIEIRSIIEAQGDGYSRQNVQTKKLFEHADAYQTIKKTFLKDDKQQEKNNLTPIDPCDYYVLTPKLMEWLPEEQLEDTLLESKTPNHIIYRGIVYPSYIREKVTHKTVRFETCAALELYKTFRLPTEATRSNKLGKHGNPNRSVSWKFLVADCGFYDDKPNMEDVVEIKKIDFNSGRYKKKEYSSKVKVKIALTIDEKQQQLSELDHSFKMGGQSRGFCGAAVWQDETIYHIKKDTFKGVFYTLDPNYTNYDSHGNYYPFHRYAPALKAIFLQKEFKLKTGKDLDIIEHSVFHNYSVKKQFTKKDIITMWTVMCEDYINTRLEKNNLDVINANINMLQIKSMYGHDALEDSAVSWRKKLEVKPASAISNYDESLKADIINAIELMRKQVKSTYQEKVKNIIKDKASTSINWIYDNVKEFPDLLKDANTVKNIEMHLKSWFSTEKNIEKYIIDRYLACKEGNDKPNKIFKLSLKISSKEITDFIKEQASIFLKNKIKEEKTCPTTIEKTMKFATSFTLQELIRHLWLDKLNTYTFTNDFKSIVELLKSLNKHKLLNNSSKRYKDLPSDIHFAKQSADFLLSHNTMEKLLSASQSSDLKNNHCDHMNIKYYFDVINEINKADTLISEHTQKEILRNYLSSFKAFYSFNKNDKFFIKLFRHFIIDDKDLFTLVIEKLLPSGDHRYSDYLNIFFDYLVEKNYYYVKYSKRLMPWQQEIIQQAEEKSLKKEIIDLNFNTMQITDFAIYCIRADNFLLKRKGICEILINKIFDSYKLNDKINIDGLLGCIRERVPTLDEQFNESQLQIIKESREKQPLLEVKSSPRPSQVGYFKYEPQQQRCELEELDKQDENDKNAIYKHEMYPIFLELIKKQLGR